MADQANREVSLVSKSEIFKFAVPSMLEELFTTFTSIIDSKMVSVLGISYISAISVTFQPKFFLFAPFVAVNAVLSSLVSFYYGKKDRKRANAIFLTALYAVIILSIVLGILSCVFAGPIMKLCSGQEDTMDLSIQYFRIVLGGMIFNQLLLLVNAGLRGYGKTSLAFTSNAISCIVNVCFNYLLIEGRFGFPALKIQGAAIATVAGTLVAFLYTLIFILRQDEYLSLVFSLKNKIKASVSSLKEILHLWKEAIVENILMRFGFLISSAILARTGSFEVSVYSVASLMLSISYAFGRGFLNSAVVLIGRNRGAGHPDLVRKYSFLLMRISAVFSVVSSLVIILISEPYVRLYNTSPDFVSLGVKACFFIAAASLFQVPKVTFTGMLQGLGMMKQTKQAAIWSVLLLQPVLNVLFVFILKLGIYGILISGIMSQLAWLLTSALYYRKGLALIDNQSSLKITD